MRDRLGNDLHVGEIVKIVGNHIVPMQNYWKISAFIQYETATEAVLCHFIDNTVEFIPLNDIEKPFK